MSRFNLSEWALEHTQFVVFFMLLAVAMGILSYKRLGRSEDPSFTIRCMIISTYWPGASARMIEDQVTDKIEKKLQETRGLDYLQSFTRAGVSVIYVYLKDEVLAADIRPTWTQVRNSVGDIRATLPRGVVGPFFNDRFDDTFGSIYALTADGFTTAELKEYADKVRLKIMTVPDVAKADFLGVQSEVIFVEIENSRLATLGLEPDTVIKALQAQSIIAPAGMVDTATDNIYLRVSGMFQSVEQIRGTGIEANNRILRLGDIARIRRAYSEPSDPKMYFNGQPAIGLAISMTDGGNVLDLGENLNALMAQLKKELPAGIDIHQVSDQPKVVEESIGEFMEALIEAVIIVLAVSFVSLGVRAGIVVALAIPLVLCTVFTCMELLGIDLHKISLGALIIALGLLVDDAIISVEMMALKLEQGWDRVKAAGYAFTATSFPMLTGTLITAAGFIPVGFSKGGASEYAGAIFSVVGIALLVSWVVAVTVTPLLGHAILKEDRSAAIGGTEHEIADTKFTTVFRATLVWCLRNRRTVVGATLATFAAAVAINPLVPKEFFPASPRPELIVDMRLPEGSSLSATDREVRKFNELIRKDPDIVNFASYVGQGSPRFVLTFNPTLPASNFGQLVILAKDGKARERLTRKIEKIFAQSFPSVNARIKILPNGPPAQYPVMFRVSGYGHDTVKETAEALREIMLRNKKISMVEFDWYQKNRVLALDIDLDKARLMGIDTRELALALNAQISGLGVAEFHERDKLIGIVVRMEPKDRRDLSRLKDLVVPAHGGYIPLAQIARLKYESEEALVWRRNLIPTITVGADIVPGVTGNDVSAEIMKAGAALRAKLPFGYAIQVAGNAEDSEKSQGHLAKTYPAMIVVIMILLMVQLQNIPRMIMVLLTAPLGLIGVNVFLAALRKPMGFVALLGVIALFGMIMRNSVILIVQIEKHIAEGQRPWDAIIESTLLRFRPIILTAAAAILGMIPLVRSEFWGPMAVAIMGGLFVATALTLLYLPALYALWFKVRESKY